ncbi:hypothetical protein HK101_006654 [Irineochytrium annulatum]|nr:hypothetical protein HK101_006654 [Irineochytrium annulatum]
MVTHSRTAQREVQGLPTDIVSLLIALNAILPWTGQVVTEYCDKVLVIVTQLDKIGQMVMVNVDSLESAPVGLERSTTVKTVLGERDDPLACVYATHIMSMLVHHRPHESRALLLALGLKKVDDHAASKATFDEIVSGVEEAFGWDVGQEI